MIIELNEQPYEPSRHIADFHIAGFAYGDAVDVIDKIALGTDLRLVGETDNPYDPNAVALYFDTCRLGYIPRDHNELISKMLLFGHGSVFEAKVCQLDFTTHPSRQIRVTIRLKDQRSA